MPQEEQWVLYVNGSSNKKGASIDIVLKGPNQILIKKSLHFTFKTLNNQAEYEVILARLSLAREVRVRVLTWKIDYRLTVGHLNNEFQNKDATLLQYYHLVRNIINFGFDEVKIMHIPRDDNTPANALSKFTSTRQKGRYKSLLQQTLTTPLTTNTCLNLHNNNDGWMSSYIHT